MTLAGLLMLLDETVPPARARSSEAKQQLAVLDQDRRRGFCRPARSVVILLFCGLPPRSCLKRGATQRKVRTAAGFQERNVSRWSVLVSPPPLGSWAGGTAVAATITALGRGSARPTGPQRGQLWHTTGADHWSCETLLQVSSSHYPAETECSPTHERNHPT